MLCNARNPRSPSVHHGIVRVPADPARGKWRGTLCDSRGGALTRNGVQVLEETTDPVTCLRCLAAARRKAA